MIMIWVIYNCTYCITYFVLLKKVWFFILLFSQEQQVKMSHRHYGRNCLLST